MAFNLHVHNLASVEMISFWSSETLSIVLYIINFIENNLA